VVGTIKSLQSSRCAAEPKIPRHLEREFALIQGESPRIRHYRNSSGFRVGGSVILTNVKTP
jgi:hypothetical protein